MNGDLAITFELTGVGKLRCRELAADCDKTLEEVHRVFRFLTNETLAHPFKDALPQEVLGLLDYLEVLTKIDCECIDCEDRIVMKGLLVQGAFLAVLVGEWYEHLGQQA